MKDKEVFYVAHPVSGDPVGNAHKAIAWIRWLTLNHPERVYVAPWVAEVLAFKDLELATDDPFYDRVLSDDEAVVRRLDGILLVGGRISTGMARELDSAVKAGKKVHNFSQLTEPPATGTLVDHL